MTSFSMREEMDRISQRGTKYGSYGKEDHGEGKWFLQRLQANLINNVLDLMYVEWVQDKEGGNGRNPQKRGRTECGIYGRQGDDTGKLIPQRPKAKSKNDIRNDNGHGESVH